MPDVAPNDTVGIVIGLLEADGTRIRTTRTPITTRIGWYAFLESARLTRDIGAEFEYSNLGMGLLGHALARRAGTSSEALLEERVLAPLGMTSTVITLDSAHRARLAPGHTAGGRRVKNWDLPALAGAGALRSSADDMLTYLAANIDPPSSELGEAIRRSHEPRFTVREGSLEIVTGATAIVLAVLLGYGLAGARAARVWNWFGVATLIMLAIVVWLNAWIAETQFVWMPTFLLPFAAFGHVVLFRRLRLESGPRGGAKPVATVRMDGRAGAGRPVRAP